MRCRMVCALVAGAMAVSGGSVRLNAAAPTVSSTVPAKGATSVAVSQAVSATFSTSMNAATITGSTFTLKTAAGAAVAGSVTYASTGSVATFTPSANLAFKTTYTATMSTGAKSAAGTALASAFTWTFTTVAGPPAPTVTSVGPTKGASNVAISSNVVAAFSLVMDPTTITASTFTLKTAAGAAVAGTVLVPSIGTSAGFTPSANLAYSTTYTATLTTGVKSEAEVPLASAYTWTFTTVQPPPPPTVTSTTPAKAATSVPSGQVVTATFSTAMNPASINATTFTLSPAGGGAVAGTVSYNATGSVASFAPSSSLLNGTVYTATIAKGAQNATGTALASNYAWTFTTVPAPAPTVVSTIPAKGGTATSVSQGITATFSQKMNATTLTSSTFSLVTSAGAAVKGTASLSSDGFTATFSPAANLAYSSGYTATITTGVKSAAGMALAAKFTWSFNTGAVPLNPAVVDFGSAVQTIRGFGGSSAWISNFTAAQADSLFGNSSSQQIGLSLLRLRIDPGGSAQWGTELNNAKLASARGASVFATPWTPPANMKSNNNIVMGSLNPSSYGDFAKYLESFVTYMANGGVNLYAISLQNEPDANVTYESCVWTPAQIDTWVANNASVLTAKLIIPESESFNPGYSNPALNDAKAVNNFAIVGGHLYGVNPSEYKLAEDKGKEVWMTEHSISQTGFGGALSLAMEVHDSMTVANYNAYVYWWINNWTSGNYVNGLIDESGNITSNGYAMGQYSKFVRPGYVRSNATSNPNPLVFVSAYKGDGHFVIVATNMGTVSVDQPFTIQNQSLTTLTPYRTSASENIKKLNPITVSSGTFVYTLPAKSITTLVQ